MGLPEFLVPRHGEAGSSLRDSLDESFVPAKGLLAVVRGRFLEMLQDEWCIGESVLFRQHNVVGARVDRLGNLLLYPFNVSPGVKEAEDFSEGGQNNAQSCASLGINMNTAHDVFERQILLVSRGWHMEVHLMAGLHDVPDGIV